MLAFHDPLYPNWDQDAPAKDDQYEVQDPLAVVHDLEANVAGLAGVLDDVSVEDWRRTGWRSVGTQFTIDSISRYMVHDPIHHVWDVTSSTV